MPRVSRGTGPCGLRGRLAVAMSIAVPKSVQAQQNDYLRRVRPPAWQTPDPQAPYDVVVVGGGPAGLAAAESASRQGRSVALVERHRLGGNSVNSGSIPSKAIIRAATVLSTVRDGGQYGVAAAFEPTVNWATVMARMRAIRTRVAEYHSAERLTARGIDVFFDDARFVGPHVLRAGEVSLTFKKAIIAAAAALSIGGAMAATSAEAAPWHDGGGWRGGGWHDGWRGGYGWRAPATTLGADERAPARSPAACGRCRRWSRGMRGRGELAHSSS